MANVYAFKDAAHYVEDGKALCGKSVNLSEAQGLGPRPRGVTFCGACVAKALASVQKKK